MAKKPASHHPAKKVKSSIRWILTSGFGRARTGSYIRGVKKSRRREEGCFDKTENSSVTQINSSRLEMCGRPWPNQHTPPHATTPAQIKNPKSKYTVINVIPAWTISGSPSPLIIIVVLLRVSVRCTSVITIIIQLFWHSFGSAFGRGMTADAVASTTTS